MAASFSTVAAISAVGGTLEGEEEVGLMSYMQPGYDAQKILLAVKATTNPCNPFAHPNLEELRSFLN